MSTPRLRSRYRNHRPHHAGIRADPDAGGDGFRRQSCSAPSADAATSCSRAARVARRSSTPASCPISCPRRGPCAKATGPAPRIGADIADRRVEITGPVDRKMIVNALNSGAQVFMADFEDANTPRWDNNLQGHINLRDAIRRRIDFVLARGQVLRAQRQDRHAVRASARLAPAGEAREDRRPARVRRHLRLRPVLLPQREGTARARQRPVLLPAQARKPPRGAAVERHLRHGAGRARRAARAPSRPRC